MEGVEDLSLLPAHPEMYLKRNVQGHSSNWLCLAQNVYYWLLHMTSEHYSMACHITSNLDFDKGVCVIHIEWTKDLWDIYQSML